MYQCIVRATVTEISGGKAVFPSEKGVREILHNWPDNVLTDAVRLQVAFVSVA